MTVQTNTNVATFNGNGVTQIFPIAFKFNNDADLVVLLVDDDTGVSSLLTLNSDYTVSGEGDEEGGLINVVVAPAAGQRLKVSRIVDILQLLDLRNQGKFFAEVHEDALDLLTMIAQQHQSEIASSIRVAASDPEPSRLPPVASRANMLMAFDSLGNPIASAPASGDSAELALNLANGVDPSKGAALVGYGAKSVKQALDDLQQKATFTVYVPSDYPTLQAAVNAVSKFRVSNGQFIDVMIEAGYQIAAGVSVVNMDLSHVRIKSVDATVSLASGFIGIPSSDPFADNAIFAAENAGMVQLACLINANDLGGPGYYLTNGSRGFVSGACGVWNAGKFGLYLTKGSRCIAANADFRQANWGNRVTTNSMLEAPQCKFYGAKVAKYEGSNNAANLDVSRGSVVYITGSTTEMTNLIGGAGHGLAVRRSFVSATLVDCSSVSGNGLNIGSGSVVTFQGGRAASCGVDAVACDASFVDASNTTLINAGRYGLYAESGGKISARGVSAGGAITNVVRAANGSTINVSSGACRKGETDSSTDIVVSGGSIVHAVGATGGTNISALTLNIAGLIFK